MDLCHGKSWPLTDQLISWVYSSYTPLEDGRNNHSYYDPSKSSTSKSLDGYIYNITYGDGSSSHGVVYTDVVNYAGVKYPTQAVEAVEFVSSEYVIDLNFDGYFGLGPDTGNQGRTHIPARARR